MKYAVATSEQSRFSPTQVGEFYFLPECNLHVWKGKFATSMSELAEQVNAATEFLASFGSPFVTLRVVEIEKEGDAPCLMNDPSSVVVEQAISDAEQPVQPASSAENLRKKLEAMTS